MKSPSSQTRKTHYFLLIAVFSLTGCIQEQYSECPTPRESLHIMFKPKASSLINSHSFCIVCDPTLNESEFESWAIEMGAPQGPQDPSSVHPCLYAYADGEIETMQQCEQLVCDNNASYNDMVGKNNGNFDLSPILQ